MKGIKCFLSSALFMCYFLMQGQEYEQLLDSLPKVERKQGVKLNDSFEMIAYRPSTNTDSLYIKNVTNEQVVKYAQVKYYEPFNKGFVVLTQNLLKYSKGLNHEEIIDANVERFYVLGDKTIVWEKGTEIIIKEGNKKTLSMTKSNKKVWSVNHNAIIYESLDNKLVFIDTDALEHKIITEDISDVLFIKDNSNEIRDVWVVSYKTSASFTDQMIVFTKERNDEWKKQFVEIPYKGYKFLRHNVFVEPDHKSIYHLEYETFDTIKTSYVFKNEHTAYRKEQKSVLRRWNLNTTKETISSDLLLENELPINGSNATIVIDRNSYDARDEKGIHKADIYYKVNNEKRKVLTNHTLFNDSFFVSEKYQLIVYFKDKQWWYVDLKNLQHIQLTNAKDSEFFNHSKRYLSEPDHYGFVGWSKSKKGFYINDTNDVWFVDLLSYKNTKITNSSEHTISRLYKEEGNRLSVYSLCKCKGEEINDVGKILAIETNTNTQYNSILEINEKGYIKRVVELPNRMYSIKTSNTDALSYIKESASVVPTYVVQWKSKRKGILSYTMPIVNNPQLDLPKVQRIAFQTAEGVWLRGSLHYPIHWNKNNKYPILFNIYETGRTQSNIFEKPTMQNYNGFNKTVASKLGYFVFYPDLRYERNETTKYLIKDLQEYIKYIEKLEPTINSNARGIIGHSFGGYEVLDVISRSSLFNAAVAGAGIASLTEAYYNTSLYGESNLFRFENVQHDSDPIFDNYDILKYDPLLNAKNINTPLLLWTGEKDERVNSNQSEMMYWALWRQKKVVEYYNFKGESHTLNNPIHQEKLTQVIIKFFEKYLKGEEAY